MSGKRAAATVRFLQAMDGLLLGQPADEYTRQAILRFLNGEASSLDSAFGLTPSSLKQDKKRFKEVGLLAEVFAERARAILEGKKPNSVAKLLRARDCKLTDDDVIRLKTYYSRDWSAREKAVASAKQAADQAVGYGQERAEVRPARSNAVRRGVKPRGKV